MIISLIANGFAMQLDDGGDGHYRRHRDCFVGRISISSGTSDSPESYGIDADIPLSELALLREIADDFMKSIVRGENPIERGWLDTGTQVRITFLDGDVCHGEDGMRGELILRVMLNVGHDASSNASVYAGYEGTISVFAMHTFLNNLSRYVSSP